MTSAIKVRLVQCLMVPTACCLLVGQMCTPQPNVPADQSSGTSVATSNENAASVNAALGEAENRLRQGADPATVRGDLLARLQADPLVLGAGLDDDNETIWADFRNGETQCFTLIDVATDPDGPVTGLAADAAQVAPAAIRPPQAAPIAVRAPSPARQVAQGTGSGYDTYYRMPANNRALLANAITAFHADKPYTNSTNTLWKMLSDRGYDIELADNLTVDHFRHLTDYGLIVIEAHGTWRKPEYPAELLQLPPSLGIPNTGTCGGDGSKQVLLTTTVATQQNLIEYAGDIGCGRLVLWNVSLRYPGGRVERTQCYGVTPNFVRQHDQGTFPSNTILMLNSCRGFNADFTSPYEQMLFEKCGSGAMFIGWTAKADYAYAGRAAVNLFQIASCSNEELIADGTTVLKKSVPPQGNTFATMRGAWGQLNSRGYTFDPQTLGQLIYTDQQVDYRDMVLMPHLTDWWSSGGYGEHNQYEVVLFSVGIGPSITIGSQTFGLQRESGSTLSPWLITGSSTAYYGNMVVTEQGRSDVPRVLHRWRPLITITNVGGGMQYMVTFTLQARAAVNAYRTSAWFDPPTAAFGETVLDKPMCWVAWNVSGETTYTSDYGPQRAVYSGSGSRVFGDSDWGSIRCSDDGSSVDIQAVAHITYTTTTTNLNTGETSTYDTTASPSAEVQGVALSPNWTIAAVTYQGNDANLGDYQVKWNAIPAEPPFDPATEPR